MGLKGDSGHQRVRPTATGDQLRIAQLTLEGKSTDDDPSNIQRLIKKVIETTRCTHAQAELALYDNDNDIAAAVDYLLEHAAEIESWTEQKSKKDKKKEDEEKEKRSFRGQSSSRGRGGFVDRGGRGRGGTTPRGPSRGTAISRRGRGGAAPVRTDSRSQIEQIPKPVDIDLTDDNSEWKSGPMEFKRSMEPESVPSSSSASAPVPAAPISFAAVAAAAARKEELKKKQVDAPPSQSVIQPDCQHEEPATSVEAASLINESFEDEPSVAHSTSVEVELDVQLEAEVTPASVPLSPSLQANASWTNQLKSELGIGLQLSAETSPREPSFSNKVQSLAPAPAGVEFDTDAHPTGLVDYQFGFVDISPAPVEMTSVPPAPAPSTESLFNTSRHSVATVASQKPSDADRVNLTNGDYSMKNNASPHPYGSSQPRALSFADPSTVSYNPAPSERQQTSKPSHAAHSQSQQQAQSHQQQPAMFPQQHVPYTSFPYMNMYSPVTGVRADDPYSTAALMQYPFGPMGVDLSAILPGSNPMPPSGNTQPMQTNQHRTDSHSIENMKYQSQNNRDQNQQQSNVAPPPGFAGAGSFMPQPALSSLFMQQQYQPHPYPFMMPNVANSRQMYPQEDDRKSYDKMGGAKQAQSTPPLYHGGHSGPGGYLNMGGINKKPYNWNN